MKQMKNKHTRALEDILSNPELIGVHNVNWKKMEVPFHKGHVQVGEADLILHSSYDGLMYVVEYKCNDCEHNRSKAKDQLSKAFKYLPLEYGFRINVMLYVYGDFNSLEYKPPTLFISR